MTKVSINVYHWSACMVLKHTKLFGVFNNSSHKETGRQSIGVLTLFKASSSINKKKRKNKSHSALITSCLAITAGFTIIIIIVSIRRLLCRKLLQHCFLIIPVLQHYRYLIEVALQKYFQWYQLNNCIDNIIFGALQSKYWPAATGAWQLLNNIARTTMFHCIGVLS